MSVLKMHYALAGLWLAVSLGSTGCCSSGSCCNRVASNQPAGIAPAVSAAVTMPAAPQQLTQKNCPVTGDALGSMGTPIAVRVNNDAVYVCCQGCVKTVQQNHEVYLGKVLTERNSQP